MRDGLRRGEEKVWEEVTLSRNLTHKAEGAAALVIVWAAYIHLDLSLKERGEHFKMRKKGSLR